MCIRDSIYGLLPVCRAKNVQALVKAITCTGKQYSPESIYIYIYIYICIKLFRCKPQLPERSWPTCSVYNTLRAQVQLKATLCKPQLLKANR